MGSSQRVKLRKQFGILLLILLAVTVVLYLISGSGISDLIGDVIWDIVVLAAISLFGSALVVIRRIFSRRGTSDRG